MKKDNGENVMNDAAVAMALEELECEEGDLTSEPVPNEFFKKWTVWRVTDGTMPPRTVFIATDGILAHPLHSAGDFGTLTTSEPVRLRSVAAAVRYAAFCVDLTMPDAYLLKTVDDIPGVSKEETKTWKGRVSAPTAGRADGGYKVEAWLWEEGTLSLASLLIDESGRIDVRLDKAADNIGVAIGME